MRYSYSRNLLTLGWLLAIFYIGCSLSCCNNSDCEDATNPECSNYDPCYEKVATTADFGFYRRYNFYDSIYYYERGDTQRYWGAGVLDLKAESSQMSSYEWRLGADPRIWTDSILRITFESQDVVDGPFSVQLITTQEDYAPDCFVGDAGRDTVTKNIVLVQGNSQSSEFPLYGMYLGAYEDDPEHKFIFNLTYESVCKLTTNWGSKECTDLRMFYPPYLYKEFFITRFHNLHTCLEDGREQITARGYLDDSYDTLFVDVTFTNTDTGDSRDRRFVGRRQ